jgi:hypothetical protein
MLMGGWTAASVRVVQTVARTWMLRVALHCGWGAGYCKPEDGGVRDNSTKYNCRSYHIYLHNHQPNPLILTHGKAWICKKYRSYIQDLFITDWCSRSRNLNEQHPLCRADDWRSMVAARQGSLRRQDVASTGSSAQWTEAGGVRPLVGTQRSTTAAEFRDPHRIDRWSVLASPPQRNIRSRFMRRTGVNAEACVLGRRHGRANMDGLQASYEEQLVETI